MKFAIVLASMLLVSVLTPGIVFGYVPNSVAGCPTTEQLGNNPECLREQRESGKEVKFVDMYFSEGASNMGGNQNTNIPTKIEVAPGDGTTKLVAVMANSGSFVLTGMRGWLSLPIGFEAAGRAAGEPAFDTYDLAVPTGGVFIFEFPVVVTENTRVGLYDATLHVEYFKEKDIGMSLRDFQIEFLLTGKSVLDARAVNSVLYPSTSNNATIDIVNEGNAPASGAIITLADTGSQIVSIGSKIWSVGVIKPHSHVTINPVLYVDPSLANSRQNLQIQINYFNAYGQKQSITIPVNFLVAGSSSRSIDFSVITDKPVIPTITRTPLTVSIDNSGIEPASSVEITVSTPITATVALNQQVPEASKSPIMILGGDGYTRVDTIRPGEKTDVNITLFASEEAVNTAFQLPVNISYLDLNGGSKHIQRFVSVYVQGTIKLRTYDLGITYIANQPNLSGYLLNEGTNLALFTTVELVDNQDIIKANAGQQYLGDLTANSPLPFNIPVSLAEGTSVGKYPVTIKVTYSDDLRIPFDKQMNNELSYTPPMIEKKDTSSAFSNMGLFAGVGAAGVGGYYFVRRRKKSSTVGRKDKDKNSSDADMDFLGDVKQ